MEENLFRCPVRSLQTMLRIISACDQAHNELVPDGIYGPETIAAVSAFQKQHALPVTGITNEETWNQIVAEYDSALTEVLPAYPIQVSLPDTFEDNTDISEPCLSLAQCMLSNLSTHYHCICCPQVTGKADSITKQATEQFQELCCLPMTGRLDKHTWKHLCLQFPAKAQNK